MGNNVATPVREGQLVNFTYTNLHGETRQRLVRVNEVRKDGFRGVDLKKNGFRNFKNDGVAGLKVLLNPDETVVLPGENIVDFFNIALNGAEPLRRTLEKELPNSSVRWVPEIFAYAVAPRAMHVADGYLGLTLGDDYVAISSTDDGTVAVEVNGQKQYGLANVVDILQKYLK